MDDRTLRLKYFADTDTAPVESAAGPPVETRELDENINLDLGADGHAVSPTIEHAQRSAGMEEFAYERLPAKVGS